MELLVRIVDKPRSGNADLDAKRTTAGDVIAFAPDGHIWGKREVANPEWRIVRVPGLPRVLAEALTAVELPTAFGSGATRKRQMTVDLERLDSLADGALLAERTATPRSVDCVIAFGDLRECMSLKPKRRGR